MDVDDMLNLCRLCQSRPGSYKLLNGDLSEQIFICTSIKTDDKSNEFLPPAICDQCKKIIGEFFNYLQRVRKTDHELRKLIEIDRKLDDEEPRDFKCPDCSERYSRLAHLRSHREIHDKSKPGNETNDGKKIDECKSDEADVKHEKVVDDEIQRDGQEKGSFKCKVCKREFVWMEEFRSHESDHKTLFICKWDNCKKLCTSAYTLKTHEMKHEGKRPFLCVTCGKGFVTKNSLTCHEKIHLAVKAYACNLCNIGFSVRSNLRAHEKKYHEGVRFYCSQCMRAYISKASLERHERLHTGIKEYQCESCPSAFYTSKELAKHRRYHQGIRSHKCAQCFKTFFEKHHLTIHLRIHTGERPYVCKIAGCGKSFTESQKLTRHLKATHIHVK